MDLESSTAMKIRDILDRIEEKQIIAYDGFMEIRWIADVYMIGTEMENDKNK